jgi:hypothetical protein
MDVNNTNFDLGSTRMPLTAKPPTEEIRHLDRFKA